MPVGSTRRTSPQRGDDRLCEHWVGRATKGAPRQTPPPAEGQVPRHVPTPEDRQQGRPPDPPLPHPPRKAAKTARGQRGDMGEGAGQATTPGGETGGKR